LKIALKLKAQNIRARSDSQLVVQQFYKQFEAKDPTMKRYLDELEKLTGLFTAFELQQVSCTDNYHADVLSKLATATDSGSRTVRVEKLEKPSYENHETLNVEEGSDWRTSYINYLLTRVIPNDANEARKIRICVQKFTLIGNELYKRGFSQPLLKCL